MADPKLDIEFEDEEPTVEEQESKEDVNLEFSASTDVKIEPSPVGSEENEIDYYSTKTGIKIPHHMKRAIKKVHDINEARRQKKKIESRLVHEEMRKMRENPEYKKEKTQQLKVDQLERKREAEQLLNGDDEKPEEKAAEVNTSAPPPDDYVEEATQHLMLEKEKYKDEVVEESNDPAHDQDISLNLEIDSEVKQEPQEPSHTPAPFARPPEDEDGGISFDPSDSVPEPEPEPIPTPAPTPAPPRAKATPASNTNLDVEVRVAVAEAKGELLAEVKSDAKLLEYKIARILKKLNSNNPAIKKQILMIRKLLKQNSQKKY